MRTVRVHYVRKVISLRIKWSDVAHILLIQIIHEEILEAFKSGLFSLSLIMHEMLILNILIGLYIRELWGVNLFLNSNRGMMRGLFNFLRLI